MSTTFAISVVGVGLVLLALWRMVRPAAPPRRGRHPDIDYEVLEQAEKEVRDLDASVTPDEADDQLSDWGPGAPKPPN